MKLFLIRHAIAEARNTKIEEAARALTSEGKHRMSKVAKHLAEVGLSFDVLLTSPWARARETAEILIEHHLCKKHTAAPFAIPTMSQEQRARKFTEWLECEATNERKSVCVVGHSPILEEWAEMLLLEKYTGKITLKKGGVIGIELPKNRLEPGQAKLLCLLSPKMLLGA